MTTTELASRPFQFQHSSAEIDVLQERRRQVNEEGWTPEHDDQHQRGELARAAAAYAVHWTMEGYRTFFGDFLWPWDKEWWKPGRLETGKVAIMRRRNLVKAAALLLAEIERLDRLEEKR